MCPSFCMPPETGVISFPRVRDAFTPRACPCMVAAHVDHIIASISKYVCIPEVGEASASCSPAVQFRRQLLQRILRFLCFTNIIGFLELLVLGCGVFLPILLVFWNYWNYWYFTILLELLELLVFSNIIGIIAKSKFYQYYWNYCYFQ